MDNITHQNNQPIDKNKWIEFLSFIDKSKRTIWIDLLLMFFYQPNHQATVKDISRLYSLSIETVKTLIQNISEHINKVISPNVPSPSGQEQTSLLFQPTQENKEILQLRPSLVAALRTYLIDRLIKQYREPVLEQGLDNRESDELYKWKIFSEFSGKPTKEILDFMCSGRKEMNFLSWRITDYIRKSLKGNPKETVECFDVLRNSQGEFHDKFSSFVSAGNKLLSKEASSNILKENVASVFLTCVDPTTYVVYRWSLYSIIAKYLGYKPDRYQSYDSFVRLLRKIEEREREDTELMDKIKEETGKYFWNPLLNSQDVVWQTHNYIKESYPKNWLQKLYERGLKEEPKIFGEWTEKYTNSVNTFHDMFGDGKTSQDVDDNTKGSFLREKDNHISSNGQGMYSYEEYGKILEHWDEIYEVLKRNVEADTISLDDYKYLNQLIQSLLKRRKPTAYHRIWAGIFPKKLCTVIEPKAFNATYEKIRQIDDSLPPLKNTWVESNQTLMDYFKEKVNFRHEHHRPIFGWYLKENLDINETDNNMQKYIELLEKNHNLVLTGAPGTGKTYLAKRIAEAMGDPAPGFVQFHPSLDYTDFVEGLRPDPETSSFERVDGIFKKFCKEALSGVQLDKSQLKEAGSTHQPGKKVFIIDEINRGELSKIFGELFFSIEPSYRGEKNKVATQYQNLVPPGDPFEKGFYVPENVYIIGTMNDIDRGVESMDFAIRRRFVWVEIKPEDRKEMLLGEIPEYAEMAAKVMESVNKTLTGKDIDLPEAYEIGPAYFLKLNSNAYDGDFQKLWDFHIRGLLYEYLRGDRAIKEKMEILKDSFFKPWDN